MSGLITKPAVSAPTTEKELLVRAQQLAGLNYAQIAARFNETVPDDLRKTKGWGGQLLERSLGATANSLPEPDFQLIGVELKTLPLNQQGKPKESTYVCTVPLTNNLGLKWETSWVRTKLNRVLWIPVEGETKIPLAERRIGMPLLWSPSPRQQSILQQDWEELMDLICLGQLEDISAHYGTYLQIRPKAANSRVLTQAYDRNGQAIQTLPRGFYLRPKLTQQIIEESYQQDH